MPADIVDLVDAFPMGLADCPISKFHFTERGYLPPRSRSLELVELYYRNISWMFVLSICHIKLLFQYSHLTLGMTPSSALTS